MFIAARLLPRPQCKTVDVLGTVLKVAIILGPPDSDISLKNQRQSFKIFECAEDEKKIESSKCENIKLN